MPLHRCYLVPLVLCGPLPCRRRGCMLHLMSDAFPHMVPCAVGSTWVCFLAGTEGVCCTSLSSASSTPPPPMRKKHEKMRCTSGTRRLFCLHLSPLYPLPCPLPQRRVLSPPQGSVLWTSPPLPPLRRTRGSRQFSSASLRFSPRECFPFPSPFVAASPA